jgi:hypothetical protein
MKGVFRSYIIERDEAGLPVRMVWTGDYRTVPIEYETCPRCEGQKLVHGRCLKCWGDWSRETKRLRV